MMYYIKRSRKSYLLAVSIKSNIDYLLNLLLYNKAFLKISILLVLRKISLNPPLLILNISINLTFVKLGLANISIIFTLTRIQKSLELNQIILQSKIQKKLHQSLDI